MSDIRDNVEGRIAKYFYSAVSAGIKFKATDREGISKEFAGLILSIPELAIVDREASPPSPGIDLDKRLVILSGTYGAYKLAQQDMTEANWVKEVKQ